MPINWTTYDYSPAPCLPCCEVPAVTCYLTLPPPIGGTPYANSTEASAIINEQTSNCLVFINSASFVALSASANATAIAAGVSGNLATTGVPIFPWVGLGAEAADVLTMAYPLIGAFGATMTANIYDSAGNIVEGFTSWDNRNPFVSAGLPDAGCYTIEFAASALLMPTDTLTANIVVTTSGNMNPATVRAAYGNVPDYVICT